MNNKGGPIAIVIVVLSVEQLAYRLQMILCCGVRTRLLDEGPLHAALRVPYMNAHARMQVSWLKPEDYFKASR